MVTIFYLTISISTGSQNCINFEYEKHANLKDANKKTSLFSLLTNWDEDLLSL